MVAERKEAFIRRAGEAIRATGFGTTGAHQASVLVFDAQRFADSLAGAGTLLDPRERMRAARFRYQSDRAIYTVAHAVWRVALGQCLGIAADDVPLASTPDGQPRLAGCALSTSLSHSGPTVAISISSSVTVGVDIEQMPAKIDLEALVPMFCTQREAADVRDLMPACRTRRLMELWTRKEALLKAFGVGLLTDPAATPAPPGELLMPPVHVGHYPACHTRNLGDGEPWIAAIATPAHVRDAYLHVM
jgi:4'-phosphopantetheinyl transferase